MANWSRNDITGFGRDQWWMLAPVFKESSSNPRKVRHYELDDMCVMPFIEDYERTNTSVGGFGTVWAVRIHPAHQLWNTTNYKNPNPLIALKKLNSTDEKDFRLEVEMLKAFSNHKDQHLIKLFATYKIKNRYHLMFPHCKYNLRTYWEANPEPKFDYTNVGWFLLQCRGIAHGLMSIHEYTSSEAEIEASMAELVRNRHAKNSAINPIPVEKNERIYGRHGDIKPENILWSDEIESNDEYTIPQELEQMGHLVIADFGLMDFRGNRSRSVASADRPASLTYAPPEHRLRIGISRAYDIWSLGCVYLEFVTWLVAWLEELHRFPDARGLTGSSGYINDDVFYTIIEEKDFPPRAIVRESVTEWMKDLHEKARCSQFIHEFVNLISEEMLVVDQNERIHSGRLNDCLMEMWIRSQTEPGYLIDPKPYPARQRNLTVRLLSPAGFRSISSIPSDISVDADENESGPSNTQTVTNFGMRSFIQEPMMNAELRHELFSAIDIENVENPLERVTPNISPETLKLALANSRFDEVEMLVDKHLSSVAKGDFLWLLELQEHSYTAEEITQLLAAEQNDSPWIYFEPRELPEEAIILEHHQSFCVHTGGHDIRNSEISIPSTIDMDTKDHGASWASEDESLTYIEEFCGLAGVIPNTRDLQKWVGSVQFEEEDDVLTASVSFRPDLLGDKPGAGFKSTEGNNHILQALENLCNAIGLAQRRGMCCNCFTYLCFNSDESGLEFVELCQIKVTAVLESLSKFKEFVSKLGSHNGDYRSFMPDTLDFTTKAQFSISTAENISDYYSLLAQFFSLAFSSYIKAHVGAFQPFFLDTPVQTIQLFGLQNYELGQPYMRASLYRLTCLDEMIQNPVLVFKNGSTRKDIQRSYDLLATPEDLVDTWGPGQFITSILETSESNLTAIMIGGGVVKPTAENSKALHWSNDIEPRHGFSVRFSPKEKVMIAESVEINTSCQGDRSERWSSFLGSLENLGTTPDYWKFTEFQAGVAVVGQQFAGGQFQFNKTWTWHPGNSWKRQYLSLTANELPINELDRPWGLQVSACTGVARRVPLRILLADVMPAIADNLALPPDWITLRQQGIITALEQGGQNFAQWYNDLCSLPNFEDLQTLTRRLIRHILLVLRNTGIDRDQKTFLIACPQGHTAGTPISMSLPVPCENASLWAKILTDSENCATFACMTTLCLESQEHKCQQTNPWHCPSLDTAVQQLRARKEPITIPSQSWNLEVNCIYWIGRPESGLQARVIKPTGSLCPRLYVSKSGVPEKTRARLGTMARLFGPKMDRLRERQINTWPAEEVLILSQSR